jgi:pre-mRNA-splicing factor 18
MQTRKDLKPLFKLLYNQTLNNEILETIFLMVRYAIFKDYVKANDRYYDLGIGNATWPMGVTMVGIHERSGRSKIFSAQVKHVLNDETQKKYIISIKRLLTI